MAISLYTVTGNASDLIGVDFDARKLKVVVSTNLSRTEAPFDLEHNKVLLGGGIVWPDSAGAFEIPDLVGFDSDDVNPVGVQYKFDLKYVDKSTKQETTWTSGWVSITEDSDLKDLIAEQYVPPTYLSAAVATLQELVDEGATQLEQQEEISGLANSDAAQAYNVDNGPLTGAALSATIEDTAAAVSEVTPAYQGIRRGWEPPITRAGAFAGLSRWLRAMSVKPISGTAGLTIATDSTGTDTSAGDGTGWPTILAAAIAATYGDITVRFRRFDWQTTSRMLAPTVIKESSLGRPKYAIGTNPSNFLSVPYGRSGLAGAGTILTSNEVDLRVKLDAKLADINGQTIQLISNYGPGSTAAERGIEMYLGTTQTLSVRTAVGGTSFTLNSDTALTWVDDTPIWLRAVLIKNNGTGGRTAKFYYSTNDGSTWTQLGADVVQNTGTIGTINSPTWNWEIGCRGGGLTWTLQINGSPTGGNYQIEFFPDNASYIIGTTYQTANIAYDADAATVQAAIRAVTGHAAFATATVTGTTTKTVTFTSPVRFARTTNTFTGGTTPAAGLSGAWGIRKINVYEVEIRDGIDGAIYGPTNVWDWDVSPSRVGYSGGPMLDIVNFAWSGHSLQNFLVQPYQNIAAVNRSQLAFILALSHNENQVKGAEWTALLDSFQTAMKARLPHAAFAATTENPQTTVSTVDQFQAARSAQLAGWAARNGWTVIDLFTAFVEDPRWVNSDGGDLLNDDRHPSHLAHETVIAPLVQRAIETGA